MLSLWCDKNAIVLYILFSIRKANTRSIYDIYENEIIRDKQKKFALSLIYSFIDGIHGVSKLIENSLSRLRILLIRDVLC